MAAPHRVQLQRRKEWRLPANTVKVDRSTRWGNPMRIRQGNTADAAVADFRLWIAGGAPERFKDVGREPPSIEEIQRLLAGRNLACWCAMDAPCHADVLLEVANRASR
jgi:uncharacterized protein DUF4326